MSRNKWVAKGSRPWSPIRDSGVIRSPLGGTPDALLLSAMLPQLGLTD